MTADESRVACITCDDLRWVCESEHHPRYPWGGMCCEYHNHPDVVPRRRCIHGACSCGAGTPCPNCNTSNTGNPPRHLPQTPEGTS